VSNLLNLKSEKEKVEIKRQKPYPFAFLTALFPISPGRIPEIGARYLPVTEFPFQLITSVNNFYSRMRKDTHEPEKRLNKTLLIKSLITE